MKITERLNDGKFHLSCEIFAPKDADEAGLAALAAGVGSLDPAFISVTCSAEEKDRLRSAYLAGEAVKTGYPVIAHLTSQVYGDGLKPALDRLRGVGIENVLALRGDKPAEGIYAADLARAVKAYSDYSFCIGGACYPEKHPDAVTMTQDIDFLRRKVEAGCEFLVTQTVFDNATVYSFLSRLRQCGINVPVAIGIMAPTDAKRLNRMARLSGNVIPTRCRALAERYGENPAAMEQAGLAYAAEQIFDLAANGINHVHIYTLNRVEATRKLLDMVSELRGLDAEGIRA